MTKVTIHLAPMNILASAIFLTHKSFDADRAAKWPVELYTKVFTFETDKTGEDAAEEAFDLTNNPGRQLEREAGYGLGRSVSTGDIVEIDDVKWICLSMGWKQL